MLFPLIKGFVYFGNALVFTVKEQVFAKKIYGSNTYGRQYHQQNSVVSFHTAQYPVFEIFCEMFERECQQAAYYTN